MQLKFSMTLYVVHFHTLKALFHIRTDYCTPILFTPLY